MHEWESGFVINKPAWHNLAPVFEPGEIPDMDTALMKAGCDWEANVEPLYLQDDVGALYKLEEHKAIVRDIDRSVLGVVGEKFVPLQNREAFRWFDPLIQSGQYQIESAGSLRGGKRIWVLVRQTEGSEFEVSEYDKIRKYLLLAHGHDGTLAVRIGPTTIRVVCMNTLQGALGNSQLVKIRHTASMHDHLKLVQTLVEVEGNKFQNRLEEYRNMANKGMTFQGFRDYSSLVFTGDIKETKKSVKSFSNVFPFFKHVNFKDGTKNDSTTVWDGFNAVTEFVTHHQGRTDENRLHNQWFGANSGLLDKAYDYAREMSA